MKNKIFAIIISFLILTNIFTYSSYQSKEKRRDIIDESIFYECYEVALEDYYNVIKEIDIKIKEIERNGSDDNSELLVTIEESIIRLKASEKFMFKSWSLNEGFPEYTEFDNYIKELYSFGLQYNKVYDEDIKTLKEIIKLEKELIPSNVLHTSNFEDYDQIKRHYYDDLVTRSGDYEFNFEDDNQLEASQILMDTLKEINELSKNSSKSIYARE